MGFWIFITLAFVTAVIVYTFGRSEERQAMSILLAAYIATMILYRIGDRDWLDLNIGILVADIIALIFLARLAYRSERYWPMPIAALHAITILVFFIVFLGQDLQSHGVGLLQTIWSYPQLMIMIWAALRAHKRHKLERSLPG